MVRTIKASEFKAIAATAVAHEATLMTADEALLNWRSKIRRLNAQR